MSDDPFYAVNWKVEYERMSARAMRAESALAYIEQKINSDNPLMKIILEFKSPTHYPNPEWLHYRKWNYD